MNTQYYTIVRFTPLQGFTEKHKFDYGFRGFHQAITLVDLKDYKYFWFEDRKCIIEKEKGGIITVQPVLEKQSCTYFIDAYVETREDVAVNNAALAQKMGQNGWTHIARGVKNYWTEIFRPDEDKLISLRGQIES